MKLDMIVCDLCKQPCSEGYIERLTLTQTHEKIPASQEWTAEICERCAKDLLKKFRSRPIISITPVKEQTTRGIEPPSHPIPERSF
jgi:superfamily II helicase